ncbi:MAG: transporter substrate-binding domain-containing protein [Verrucomicrobia bacterium]|nr:transporter substrate-binding domain-containing protein [Verrucomicrobiota bacterium]
MITKAVASRSCGWLYRIGALLLVTAGVAMAGEEPLRVGVAPDYPPMIYKQGAELLGFEVDNARAVAKTLGRELAFVELPFADLLASLESGDVDVVMNGITVTDERSKSVRFADPFIKVGLSLLVRKSDAETYKKAEDVRKAKVVVAAKKGTTGHEYARVYCFAKSDLVFVDPFDAAGQLKSGKIDIYIHDTPVAEWLEKANHHSLAVVPLVLEAQDLAWADKACFFSPVEG